MRLSINIHQVIFGAVNAFVGIAINTTIVLRKLSVKACGIQKSSSKHEAISAFEMMRHLVSMQIGLLIEALVAIWIATDEWFFAGVNSHVRLEIEVE